LVEGRRLIVITDRGQFDVFEVGAGKGGDSLTQLASREATDRQPVMRYVTVADGNIWVGDSKLAKFAILPTGDRLPAQAIENDFPGSAFDHPLQLSSQSLIHVRRPKGRAGAVVAATDVARGRTLWETDLAVPPAAAPVVEASGKALAVANANGYVFRFDESAIRSRVQDEPLTARSMPSRVAPLTGGVDLGQGKAAFFTTESDQILLYDPAQGSDGGAQWVRLQGPLACAVTPFADGLLAPLAIGQVFYVSPPDGRSLAAPFQPTLQPRSTVAYRPAAAVADSRQFVISDGDEKVYLVGLNEKSQPHLDTLAEAKVSPYRVVSPMAVVGSLAIAATEGGHLVRFRLPTLEAAGEIDLPGDVVWGPYPADDMVLLATADEKLVAINKQADIAWTVPIEHGDLAGRPLLANGAILLAYRKGILERRNLTDGALTGQRNVEQPLAAGPVAFLGRFVLAAHDGTLLVVDQP
jgi:outer membrane protein assembly factor BamB